MKFYNSSKKTFLNIRCDLLVCLLIILSILFIYQQVRHHDFINLDDDVYVTANDQVRSGLNKKSIKWSFGLDDKQHTYWHPLTWLSHMLEVELYGVEPGRHHLTNVLFHIANSLLLLFVLYRFSGALWQSAFIALVFAVHPINVESVAWVAQRKNVLSTFLWLLSLLSYGYYAAHPTLARYLLVFFAFALGLLAKPMLVTLPFVLLLLDYWPLKRLYFTQLDDGDEISAGQRPHPIFCKAGLFQLIIEKIPLFIISFLSVFLSSMSVKSLSSVISLESVPLKLRIANDLVSYISYMQKLFWPKNLAIFYPYPEAIPTWNVVCASLGLIGVTIAVVWLFKRQPYLGVGWLWYLGTLVPVSGLMQVGLWPAMADRWAYVPFIGLFIMISWGVPHLIRKGRYYQIGLFLAAAVVLVFLMATARVQVGYWRDSITLFEHEIKVTGSTWIAHQNLAAALYKRGRVADANIHFQIAENGPPSSPEGEYYQLALTLTTMGELDKAVKCYREALRINPKFVPAYINLGITLARQGKPAEAINYYSTALGLDPYSELAYFNLGNAQMAQGNVDEAIKSFNATLRIKPDFAKAYEFLGLALLRKGEMGDAVGC